MKRYYLGVDWADESHQVCVSDPQGKKMAEMKVMQSAVGLAELGRWLHERKAEEIELWAAIEKPHGRIVDFLLDHGVVVYPVNPKALDRALPQRGEGTIQPHSSQKTGEVSQAASAILEAVFHIRSSDS